MVKKGMSMNIIEVKNLNVKYNEHIALKNINMTVKEKEYICLVGKNGSGKSTLLKTITTKRPVVENVVRR